MDFEKLASIKLIQGAGGGDPKAGLCIMEMVSYFAGADMVTDSPECACPLLTRVAIVINDRAPLQEDRDSLKPLLPMLTGSRDEAARQKRGWFIMRETTVRILAVRLDRIAKKVPPHLAADIRAAETPQAMRAAVQASRELLCKHADADAYTYANTDAAAYAAAAYAAAAYAAAAYAAAAYAYAYADAYAYASAGAKPSLADRRWVFAIMRDILTEAIMLGEHGKLDMDAGETVARAEQLLALLAL